MWKIFFSTEFRDGGTRGDWEPVRWAAGSSRAGEAGSDGDPGGRGEAGAKASRGDPGSPGAKVHGAEEDAGSGGKVVQKQKRCGFFTGKGASIEILFKSLSACVKYRTNISGSPSVGRKLRRYWCISVSVWLCSAGIFGVEERSRGHFPAWGLHRPDGPAALLQPCHCQIHTGAVLHARVVLPGKGQRDLQEWWEWQTRRDGGHGGVHVSCQACSYIPRMFCCASRGVAT